MINETEKDDYMVYVPYMPNFGENSIEAEIVREKDGLPYIGYTTCMGVERRKVYDLNKKKFTGEMEEVAFFRAYSSPRVLTILSNFRIEMTLSYPVGQCPWHAGDTLKFTGEFLGNFANSPSDICVERFADDQVYTKLSETWFNKYVDDPNGEM